MHGLHRHARRGLGTLHRKLPGEMEGTALPHLTLHPEVSSHHLDQLRRDGQPESRAAIGAGGGTIGLDKGRKDTLLLLRGNANPSVNDRKVQTDSHCRL